MRTQSNPARPKSAAIAAALTGIVAVAVTSGAALAGQRPAIAEHADVVVVGTGPHAVYVGRAPVVGGDPAIGETEESYFARTRRHLPGPTSAVTGPWWYGRAPVVGGDPAIGETAESYFARTGRHLPRP